MNYKVTDEYGKTRGGTQWGPGVTHTAVGAAGQPLCTDGWIHFYESPEIAVIMNPIGGNFRNAQLWSVRETPEIRDGALMCGARTVTTVERIPLPDITTRQRVEIAIRLALHGRPAPNYVTWAERWLSGVDRTAAAAIAAEKWAAKPTEWAAVRAAKWAANWREEDYADEWAARAAKWMAETDQPFVLTVIRQVLTGSENQESGFRN